ncbi:hypothetical protein [Blastopirellula marina]|uniref:Uncharacterized protein n=1 Tax=Blastopirellula marina TaxID=124 RepID=A0A2S8FHU2_9BACT|nr:hypothetical protein [Blastopirellula marina]PQO31739.1 hypothetical protein C5Y98_20215 [Blastopirellula marina]PTL43046.1 hypothetical protein C5Y97_20225 [Blastopirellula marina]
MAKFYVESGSLRLIVDAADARRAALWAVHRALEHILPNEEEELDVDNLPEVEPIGAMVLGDAIRLSERGFENTDATQFETLDIISEWSQLMQALTRMENELRAA